MGLFSSPPTFAEMLNIMPQRRRRALDFLRARFRRFLLNPVVIWFAGIIFAILMVIMIMLLLLNIDVVGVDDLFADVPLHVTGVCDYSR